MVELIFDKNEDWENRTLCSDESCIGTIGTDGKCKECGKPYAGVLNVTPSVTDVSAKTGISEIADRTPNQAGIQEIVSIDSPSDDEWEKRVLCSDGSCIGIIGSDGKCKECGKPK